MVYQWELDKIKEWSTETIKNHIWSAVSVGQPVPGCISVEALRQELVSREKEPKGYYNT